MRPPALSVALALPTVLRSFAYWEVEGSKSPAPEAGWEVPDIMLGLREVAPGDCVARTRSRPARREMRSARSASRVVVEVSESEDERWGRRPTGRRLPWWPSLMAVVESAERDVVPELGVLLEIY